VYDQFSAVVGQSSNYLMPGEEMQISAGVGAFSKAAQPQITIGGVGSPIGADGMAVKKFNVSGSGQQSQNVVVTYMKPDGTKETKNIEVKYTVGQPGVAAVSPDKMNVLYFGIENPITIGSPVGWDKTSISMTGGTITGSGPSRMVKPAASTGKAIIKVTTDKGSKDFEFRCFPIPAPKFKIADGKARMPAVTFKSQNVCRAELENFYFDLRYSVVSATVYFSGANFPSVKIGNITGSSLASVDNFIKQCGPGSVITFDNIKVSGPDGQRTIDAVSIALY
jgi:gliding motility-associated protein GldM